MLLTEAFPRVKCSMRIGRIVLLLKRPSLYSNGDPNNELPNCKFNDLYPTAGLRQVTRDILAMKNLYFFRIKKCRQSFY